MDFFVTYSSSNWCISFSRLENGRGVQLILNISRDCCTNFQIINIRIENERMFNKKIKFLRQFICIFILDTANCCSSLRISLPCQAFYKKQIFFIFFKRGWIFVVPCVCPKTLEQMSCTVCDHPITGLWLRYFALDLGLLEVDVLGLQPYCPQILM